MNKRDKLPDKSFDASGTPSAYSYRQPKTIAKVTVCPSYLDHHKCPGYYVDVTKRYAVECYCKCHRD